MNAQTPPPSTRRRKGDLVRDDEIRRVLALLREEGVPIGAVDIRVDGVTIHPLQPPPGTAYDSWKRENQSDARPPHRS